MKVLSLLEPWSSLIAQGIKTIETRSWKTNYRGQLYIHASQKRVNIKDKQMIELISLLENKNLQYGNIIARCNLVDIQFMDEKFLKEIEENPIEKMCGEYAYGRYAWILKDIQALDNPIPAKGKLNIWDFQE